MEVFLSTLNTTFTKSRIQRHPYSNHDYTPNQMLKEKCILERAFESLIGQLGKHPKKEAFECI